MSGFKVQDGHQRQGRGRHLGPLHSLPAQPVTPELPGGYSQRSAGEVGEDFVFRLNQGGIFLESLEQKKRVFL